MMRSLLLFCLVVGLGGTLGCGNNDDDDEIFGLCNEEEDCAADRYCAALDCGDPGNCEPRPSNCSVVVALVCGCDGVTYNNECTANQAGQDIEHNGAC